MNPISVACGSPPSTPPIQPMVYYVMPQPLPQGNSATTPMGSAAPTAANGQPMYSLPAAANNSPSQTPTTLPFYTAVAPGQPMMAGSTPPLSPANQLPSTAPPRQRNKGILCQYYLDSQRPPQPQPTAEGGEAAPPAAVAAAPVTPSCPRRHDCPYLHIQLDEERPVPDTVCAFFTQSQCLRDNCRFFHGTLEQLQSLKLQQKKMYRLQDVMETKVPPPPLPTPVVIPTPQQHNMVQQQQVLPLRSPTNQPPTVMYAATTPGGGLQAVQQPGGGMYFANGSPYTLLAHGSPQGMMGPQGQQVVYVQQQPQPQPRQTFTASSPGGAAAATTPNNSAQQQTLFLPHVNYAVPQQQTNTLSPSAATAPQTFFAPTSAPTDQLGSGGGPLLRINSNHSMAASSSHHSSVAGSPMAAASGGGPLYFGTSPSSAAQAGQQQRFFTVPATQPSYVEVGAGGGQQVFMYHPQQGAQPVPQQQQQPPQQMQAFAGQPQPQQQQQYVMFVNPNQQQPQQISPSQQPQQPTQYQVWQ